MPQLIEVPGFGQVEFPDNMNDEQVIAAIQKNMIKPSEPIDSTPAWAAKHPNLYGVYGATVGTLQKLGEYTGLDKPAETIGKTAAYLTRPASITPQIAQEAGLKPSTGEVVGAGLQISSMLLPYGKVAKGLEGLATTAKLSPKLAKYGSTAITGGLGGYAYESGEKIAEGKTPTPGFQTVAGAVLPPAVEGIVSKVKGKPFDIIIGKTIKDGIDKGVRPSVQSKGQTAAHSKMFYAKAQKAVETIIENKQNLEFVDDVGDTLKGTLPKNLGEFADAIDQTKKSIFAQYDELATKAGQRGAVVDLAPVVKELDTVVNNKILNDFHPDVIAYAKNKITTLSERGAYTASEAQEAITTLNTNLQAFYRNPSYENATKVAVDAMLANKMRRSLDEVIENTTGAGYQELKNTYGALKALEKDVTHRATVDARKNIKGLVDFSDIYSGASLVHGILTMHPATIASAATAKGISSYIKWRNNPNKIISDMFEKSELLMSKKGMPSKTPTQMPRFPGDMIVDKIAGKK